MIYQQLRAFIFISVLMILIVFTAFAQSESANVPLDWRTTAEATEYRKTSTYAEAIAYSNRLVAASKWIQYRSIGRSGENRDIPLLIASNGKEFTPAAARKAGKAVIFIQAGIHAGEIDGKDAGLALLRDIAITKTRKDLLDKATILFVPIYNVDGHENRDAYKRINQNGPDEMGFRANATNLNLNRDYMKADAPETRAWLALWNEWKPDLFIDCHVTDGADFRYNVTYEYAHFQEVSPHIKNWMDEHFDGKVVAKVESEGNLLTHYVEFAGREVTGGIATFIATPRYATGYTAIRNRPGLLIETHSLKPYKSRVRGTYDILRYTIEEAGKERASLFEANKKADAETIERGKTYDPTRQFPLRLTVADKPTQITFKGFDYKMEDSQLSGAKRIVYGTKPVDYMIPRFDDGRVTATVAPPMCYIIPPQYKDVIDVLRAHGVTISTLSLQSTVDIEVYRLSEPKWAAISFENRITLSAKKTVVKENRLYPAGTMVVSMSQEAANVAIHLLEPDSPDSLLYWGFFNSIFEQKEYGESYMIEKIAMDMLAKDPELKRQFEEKLKDPEFVKSASARLRFIYERSPYYTGQKIGLYPIVRVVSPWKLAFL
jgi:murein tripeptide amidase MpaA